MKRIFIITTLVVLGLGGVMTLTPFPTANADNEAEQKDTSEQTLIFSIEKMDCAACPITVKAAMKKVEGVKSVSVDYDSKTAVVVFDSSVATATEIATASTDVGYPATVAE